MPMYEYVCSDCGYDFERVQSVHDEPLTTCPECGGTVRRVISPVGIIFKGSGWYITDSKRQITSAKAGAKAGSDAVPAAADSAPADGTTPAADAGGGGNAAASDAPNKKAAGDVGKTSNAPAEPKTP
jgi:putative FmdB family regulatory protein